jgi:hypothetical protein
MERSIHLAQKMTQSEQNTVMSYEKIYEKRKKRREILKDSERNMVGRKERWKK